MNSPVSPSAIAGDGGAVNADGSTMKTTAPNGIFPLAEQTNVPVEAILTVQSAKGVHLITTFAHRFQVADSDGFTNILSTGMGERDPQGLIRFTTVALPAAKKVFWRSRAEQDDKFGPWSPVMAFTTIGANPPGAVPSTPPVIGTPPPAGPRPPDPPAGSRLPLPDARPFINAMSGLLSTLASCPNGRKYENNPWLDRLVDNLRAVDSRWGYNGKPTKVAAENNGFPIIAAGDEIAYHYGAGPSLGSRDVYLIDTLASHCGDPFTTYRDFTGEEPGFWTGAGRFSQ